MAISSFYSTLLGLSSTQIITVPDPNTGQPIQQIVKTQIDPTTGETKQVLLPLNQSETDGNSLQIVTVQDPVTGQLQQQVVDPLTGKTSAVQSQNIMGTLICQNIKYTFTGQLYLVYRYTTTDTSDNY